MFRSFIKSLAKYLWETLRKWWVLAIGVFFASFQLIPLYVKGDTIIPNYVAIGLFLFAFFIAQYLVYHRVERILIPADQLEKALIKLTKYRSCGVYFRNKGMRLTDVAKIEKWINDSEKWDKAVLSTLSKFSKTEAGIYKTLDWIDFPPEPFLNLKLNSEHLKTLRIHSQRLISLKEIIIRYNQFIFDRKSIF